jgi:exonuclease VII large subunit
MCPGGTAGPDRMAQGEAAARMPSTEAKGAAAACPSPEQQWFEKHKSTLEGSLKKQKELLDAKKEELKRWNKDDQKNFETWFGSKDEKARKEIQNRIDKTLELNKNYKADYFKPASPEKEGRFAYVNPKDPNKTIYLDKAFHNAPMTGTDSKAGVMTHEMSHFKTVGATEDHIYGAENSRLLAKASPMKALQNADNFQYYIENVK